MPSQSEIQELIKQMTIEEKVALCSGRDFWSTVNLDRLGIPAVIMTDGPHGVRMAMADGIEGLLKSIPATCFPTASAMGATWNEELVAEVADALGEECKALGVDVLLGPGVNLKRSPLGGRNFEYYSEDPYLSGRLGASFVKTLQKHGVGACPKHFVCNESEVERFTMDSEVDERTMRELYLAPFETIVKEADPWFIMAAYNKVNGSLATENYFLLTEVLRKEWGYKGAVVSDWGAVRDNVKSTRSGMDLDMPGGSPIKLKELLNAVQTGLISEKLLDERVGRLLNVLLQTRSAKGIVKEPCDMGAHHDLAQRVASEATVLLKNDRGILPLQKERIHSMAVIGKFATVPKFQGGGSSQMNPTRVVTPLEAVRNMLGDMVASRVEDGYGIEDEQIDQEGISRAVSAARECEVVLLFAGLTELQETEGMDRPHMDLPLNQVRLIEAVLEANPNTILLISSGSPVTMPWIEGASTVLQIWLGGQAYGAAVADLLFGVANPSGKLAETFPAHLRDNPSYINYPGEKSRVRYGEGIFIGYRYYEAKGIKPLFPFGHGLSYTTFEYKNLSLSKREIGREEPLTIELDIENTGPYAGWETVQLYIKDVRAEVARPEKELKGFAKIFLKPGERQRIRFTIEPRALAYYDVNKKDWRIEAGEFEILVCASSADIRLCATFDVILTREEQTALAWELSINSTLKEWLANPKGKVVIEKYFAPLLNSPTLPIVREAPLIWFVRMMPGMFPEDFMERVIREVRD